MTVIIFNQTWTVTHACLFFFLLRNENLIYDISVAWKQSLIIFFGTEGLKNGKNDTVFISYIVFLTRICMHFGMCQCAFPTIMILTL